jgi:exodeoxyribonuclease VII large subunit
VRQIISASVSTSLWVTVEISSAKCVSAGHWYLDVAERDRSGKVLAQARAIIWRRDAESILPDFTRATGVQFGPGVKLLVRALPVFHPQYSFSLHIDAIDPSYTLGALEARRREIRSQLKAEGLFDTNRGLPPIWDYTDVLVLAPESAAGLRDFQVEAKRLEQHGLCAFTYVHSRFQGEGAPAEMIMMLDSALARSSERRPGKPDAIAIIRGGGTSNDLAWLDDYALTRFVCTCPVPVLTGIGHERDNTLLDEVAHRRYDTPSKVIAAIERHIYQRAREAKMAFAVIETRTREFTTASHQSISLARVHVRESAFRQLERGRRRIEQLYTDTRIRSRDRLRELSALALGRYADIAARAQAQVGAMAARLPAFLSRVRSGASRVIDAARNLSRDLMTDAQLNAKNALQAATSELHVEFTKVASEARDSTTQLREQLSLLLTHVGVGARQTIRVARMETEHDSDDIKRLGHRINATCQQDVARSFVSVNYDAHRLVHNARDASESLMREVVSQGPDRVLCRGFVIVRDPSGTPVTTVAAVRVLDVIDLQFADGAVAARIDKEA